LLKAVFLDGRKYPKGKIADSSSSINHESGNGTILFMSPVSVLERVTSSDNVDGLCPKGLTRVAGRNGKMSVVGR